MTEKIKNLSIGGITWRYTAAILALVLTGVVVITAAGVYSSQQALQRHEAFEMDLLSRDLGDMLGFYRNIAYGAADRGEVRDMLEFADVERAVLWAKELRSLVPDSIGVALIDGEGSVLGEPLQLNLGAQCLSDLHHLLRGGEVRQPPVHSDSPALHHFDVVVPVRSGDESLGLLFMSFSLSVLQQRLEQRSAPGRYLRVTDGHRNTLAEVGTVNGSGGTAANGVLEAAIPGSDWRLFYAGESTAAGSMFLLAFEASVVILIASLLIMLLFSTRLVAIFKAELSRIRALLDGVSSGNGGGGGKRSTRLLETDAIMEEVSRLIREIERVNQVLKQQSMHDPLTGLLNRRAFDESLAHYVGLAARGVTSRLVVLDLDLFKQVNDRYGHAVGDEVLKALADTLRERCRSADVLARMGGDEFAVIMPGEGDIDEWFRDIDQSFSLRQRQLNDGNGIEPQCHLSAGAVTIEKGGYEAVTSLMVQADRLMYEAKRRGRAAIQY